MTGVNLVELLPYVAFALFGALFSVIDIRTHTVPNRLLLGASGVFALSLLGTTIASGDWPRLLTAALSAAALFTVYLLFGLANSGGLGGGDAKFAAPVGAMLGFSGWGTVVIGTLTAFLLVALAALLTLVLQRQRGMDDPPPELPFIPFICGGAWIALLWDDALRLPFGFV